LLVLRQPRTGTRPAVPAAPESRAALMTVPREVGPTLGLCAFVHDSAAALITDGALLGFAEEEKLCGVKHTGTFPVQVVDWLLTSAGQRAADVRRVAFYFSGRELRRAVLRASDVMPPAVTCPDGTRPTAGSLRDYYRDILDSHYHRRATLRRAFPNADVLDVPHHRCHGLYAYASSGFPAAAVLTVDSIGEGISTTVAHAHGGSYHERLRVCDPHSLGYVYGAVCEHLGFRRNDEEGTVMALASFGDPARFRDVFRRAVRLTSDGFFVDPTLFADRALKRRIGRRVHPAFDRLTCPPRAASQPLTPTHADVAAALQERTTNTVLHLGGLARAATDVPRLCLAGGVALNCVAVGRLRASGLFDDVQVPPAPGDSGTALGAAIAAHLRVAGQLPTGIAGRFELGPSFERGHVAALLRERGLAFVEPERAPEFLADELAAGAIVGLFRGPLEGGPRALGGRSILASPVTPGIRDRLNTAVKFREWFRPFAPVVTRTEMPAWFEQDWDCPYMSFATVVRPDRRRQIPAVVHVDGTARVQTVDADTSPFLHRVLERFGELTGVPVLLNTSLNVKGKPMSGRPEMAIDCFLTSGLDALMIEGCYTSKQAAPR
jgi:carbamoyltransferase